VVQGKAGAIEQEHILGKYDRPANAQWVKTGRAARQTALVDAEGASENIWALAQVCRCTCACACRARVCACARVVFVLRRGTRGAFCPFGFTITSLQQSLGSTMTALQRWRRVRRDKEGPGCHGAKC
jgi:hypothetical protein